MICWCCRAGTPFCLCESFMWHKCGFMSSVCSISLPLSLSLPLSPALPLSLPSSLYLSPLFFLPRSLSVFISVSPTGMSQYNLPGPSMSRSNSIPTQDSFDLYGEGHTLGGSATSLEDRPRGISRSGSFRDSTDEGDSVLLTLTDFFLCLLYVICIPLYWC